MKTEIEAPVSVGTERDQKAATQALDALNAIEGDGTHVVEVGSTKLKLTNVDKVLYPEVGFTKLDVAKYMMAIAPAVLTHLRDRPLTLKRYPNGVDADFFYQKRAPDHRPDWVRTTPPLGDQQVDYVIPNDVRTLLWAANLADLELHPLLSKYQHHERPTVLAFDLDPGEGAGIVECCEVALLVRELFIDFGLESFAKTSGSKGIQVYVPLNRAGVTFEQTKPFAKAIAELLTKQHPHLVVAKQLKTLRRGKVLVDWSQNDDHKTTICVYSLRAKAAPTVSTPITWEEVEQAHADGDQDALRFEYTDTLSRVRENGDLFAPVLELKQSLPPLD